MKKEIETINNRYSLFGDSDSNFEELLTLYDFPIKMGVTENSEDTDYRADMTYIIDKNTGMIQLERLIPQKILYQDVHYSNIAANWKEHHKAFAEFISKWNPQTVFEIGGGTGLLAKYYLDENGGADWTILEAVPNPIDGCRAKYISGIFDEKYKIKRGYDAVVHSHTMEHFYNPFETIRNISSGMQTGSYMFFSIPNLKEIYKRKFTNVLNFEHTYFCTEPYVNIFLAKTGYEIIEKKMFKDDHSIFYAALKTNKLMALPSVEGEYEKNKQLFDEWLVYHRELIKELNNKIDNYSNSKIYLFGAHVYSQYLITFGLNQGRIISVLDNDPMKQGKRLYGTKYKVCSPKVIENDKEPVIILHAGTHNGEIKKGILKINNHAIFI